MTLSLKDQFQIKTVAAYAAADGKRFHELGEAQTYTRDKMLDSLIATACKNNPEFARLDKPLLKDFLLLTGTMAGAIMAEPLQPNMTAVTNTPRAGESEAQSAVRIRASADEGLVERLRAAAGTNARPVENAMPKAQNPDIFRNTTLQAAAAVDEDYERELQAGTEASLKQALG